MNEVEMWLKDIDRARREKMAEDSVTAIMEMVSNMSEEMIVGLIYALGSELVDRKMLGQRSSRLD